MTTDRISDLLYGDDCPFCGQPKRHKSYSEDVAGAIVTVEEDTGCPYGCFTYSSSYGLSEITLLTGGEGMEWGWTYAETPEACKAREAEIARAIEREIDRMRDAAYERGVT